MKVRIKMGFRYEAEEIIESEFNTREEIEKSISENTKGLWDELKSEIDSYVMDNPDDSRLSDMFFEYEILEGEG